MPQTLLIEGHASVFDLADLAGDVVRRGAFAASLRHRTNVPMLFQHEASEPVGVWRELREDHRGLYVRGELLAEGPRGRTALSLVRSGAIDGLSIGFRTKRFSGRTPHGRELIELDLWEVSIVTFPMLPQARLRLLPQPAIAA